VGQVGFSSLRDPCDSNALAYIRQVAAEVTVCDLPRLRAFLDPRCVLRYRYPERNLDTPLSGLRNGSPKISVT